MRTRRGLSAPLGQASRRHGHDEAVAMRTRSGFSSFLARRTASGRGPVGRAFRPRPILLAAVLAGGASPVPLAGQPGASARDAYLRAVSEHFGAPEREVSVLAQWGLSAGEIPVVLHLADRAGVSPDVVVAQRRRGGEWMDIARGLSVHAGDFHVRIDGPAGFLSAAYERFGGVAASDWSGVGLTDAEVVGLVNVRFMSRSLGVSAGEVARRLGDGGDMVAGFARLRGGDGTAGASNASPS